MKTLIPIITLLIGAFSVNAGIIEVGAGKQYTRLQTAAANAKPGDTILIYEGIYSGGDYIENLKGTPQSWIYIRAVKAGEVIFRGNTQAFHLTDPEYLHISGLIFEQQTSNGVNIDDGGTYDTPAHNIWIENCEWRGMNASGNNDELKMSGVDSFQIRKCIFRNGSTGGSLVDMVGCHIGGFTENVFENGGSNCIQAKGGTSNILIYRNKFVNGGERALNIGGSTGLQFFRPLDVKYEASNVRVYSNIFIGSTAAIAFVGATLSEVRGNTIYKPGRWTIRILQETVGNGFEPCGRNEFSDNIVVHSSQQPALNIGGNTAPETFIFSHNLWYNPDNSSWQGPNTPASNDMNKLIQLDPKFVDTVGFHLQETSPAKGSGSGWAELYLDYYGRRFAPYNGSGFNRSRGAVEYYPLSGVNNSEEFVAYTFAPNPAMGTLAITVPENERNKVSEIVLIDMVNGSLHPVKVSATDNHLLIDVRHVDEGAYFVRINYKIIGRIVVLH